MSVFIEKCGMATISHEVCLPFSTHNVITLHAFYAVHVFQT